MKSTYLLSLILICINSHVNALIHEINTIKRMKHFVPHKNRSKTLIVIDIDNTLIEAQLPQARPAYYKLLIKHYETMGIPHTIAQQQAVDYILPFLKKTAVKPAENSTVKIIQQLQNKGYPVVALTARSPIIQETLQQLQSIGITFSLQNYIPDVQKKIVDATLTRPAWYQQGVIFCNNNDKGKVLKKFLTMINFKPKKIITIDDQLYNVQSVEKMAHNNRIPFIGLRYNFFDATYTQNYTFPAYDAPKTSDVTHFLKNQHTQPAH